MGIDASFNITDFNEAALSDFGLIYQKQEYGVWNTDGPWIAQVDDYSALKIYGNNLYNIYNYDEYITGINATIFFPPRRLADKPCRAGKVDADAY